MKKYKFYFWKLYEVTIDNFLSSVDSIQNFKKHVHQINKKEYIFVLFWALFTSQLTIRLYCYRIKMLNTTIEGEDADTEKRRKELEDYLKENNVRSSEKLASTFAAMGVGMDDLLNCREKDIEDLCKEGNVAVLSRVDLLKVLRNNAKSQFFKDTQAKSQPQLVLLNPDELNKMNEIYEHAKQLAEHTKQLQDYVVQLEENSKKSKERAQQTGEKWKEEIDVFIKQTIDSVDNEQQKKKHC
ncbi:hypothetical protein RFI_24980 [Reticulomyxa filosa]|uniref:Uncharacterized protein n=1 Tax=Reticulomyxa filosa TaxID=46433 RepID=X6MFJ0_RETFI|nr:hypothetical protein RFI_24980 [Reticulomyxa filosa]|eukprot:ETO12396.1 hypothetical protein RFI_24980 [Reticulomyxa filosa]